MAIIDPMQRWTLRSELLRLVFVSTRLRSVGAPLSYIAVGPPGSGKTEMIMRGGTLRWVTTFSNLSYMGIVNALPVLQSGVKSVILIPDLATVLGRRADVGRQAVATLAMLAAEGIGKIAVGRTEKDYRGVRASVISAVTEQDLTNQWDVLSQNAFLSRAFLPTFDFTMDEIFHMSRLKTLGKLRHLRPFRYPAGIRARTIRFPERYEHYVEDRWSDLRIKNADRTFAFRTMETFKTVLCCAAFVRGGGTVIKKDVKVMDRLWPVIEDQYRRIGG